MPSFVFLDLEETARKDVHLRIRLLQGFLCFLALSNVLGNTGNTDDIAACIVHREAAIAYSPNRSIRPRNSIVQMMRSLQLAIGYALNDSPFVFGMNRFNPRLREGVKTVATAAPDSLVSRTDVDYPRVFGIAHPEDFIDVLRKLPKSFFTFPQRFLGPHAFGYLHAGATHHDDRTCLVKNRKFTHKNRTLLTL